MRHLGQKRVRGPGLIEGLAPEALIRASADPIWLHQSGLWEYMPNFSDPPVKRDDNDSNS
jgi:hypothetical protein